MIYYASKISHNMARTPEGFLLCQNVPIARTGMQEYLASELPVKGLDSNERVQVCRLDEDVFAPAAVASFEGKPLVDEHPDNEVTPDNVLEHLKGVSTNVRRGRDGDADKLIADLIVYDAELISEIENGKREVSCGYECDFIQGDDGKLYQKNIVGNHIAVVTAGRAGSHVAIKDNNPEIDSHNHRAQAPRKERRKRMAKKKPSERGIVAAVANLFPYFSKDAAPEEITDAVEELVDVIAEETKTEETPPVKTDEAPPAPPERKQDENPVKDDETAAILKTVIEKLENIDKRLTGIEESKLKDTDPLQKLEDELSGENLDDESGVIEPAGEIETEDEDPDNPEDEVADEAGIISPESSRPQSPLAKDVKDAALKEIRRMKPIIAV